MTETEKRKLYAALSAPFTDEAIERSDGRVTGKGYSTTGIKYQYVVNRLNEVIGIGSWRTQQDDQGPGGRQRQGAARVRRDLRAHAPVRGVGGGDVQAVG